MEIWKKMWVGVFFLNTVYDVVTWTRGISRPILIADYVLGLEITSVEEFCRECGWI